MAPLTPNELRTRRRVETLIRLMAPALDVVLAVGDRVSRIVERDDPEYYPPRVGRRAEEALREAGEAPHPVDDAPRPADDAPHDPPHPAGGAPFPR
jgi:hypothetical protein